MPPEMKKNVDDMAWNIYKPPDVFNPSLHPPPGAIDVLNIVEAGVDFKSVLAPDYTHFYKKPSFANPPKVTPGKGVRLNTKSSDHLCDGSVDSFCDRAWDNRCLLYGHNDGRNGLLFDGYSGWVVMNIPDLRNGFIVVKFESWHFIGELKRTDGWTSINNEEARSLLSGPSSLVPSNSTAISTAGNSDWYDHRRLGKRKPEPYCDEFKFEYAIDGKVTSMNLQEFQKNRKQVQRVVETLTLMDDPDFTGGQEKEVEVAIRITGCAHTKIFQLTHIYWS
jgi:hypothetical protein